jgi:hypothetical protein
MWWFLLSAIGHLFGGLILSFAVFLWYVRPFPVSPDVPGPKRHWLFGVVFGDGDDSMQRDEQQQQRHFDWGHWPTMSLAISRRYNFRTWGGPSINLGFGGAFFNVGESKEFDVC